MRLTKPAVNKKKQVIIVEDEIIVRKDIARVVVEMGYQVAAVVSSGEEAVEKALECRPDLLLMDIRLKGAMDGIEAVKKIHGSQAQESADIPVVYITAYADSSIIRRAMLTEPYGFIVKPFSRYELESVLNVVGHRTEMRRLLKESEERYRSLVESSSDHIFMLGPDGTYLSSNNRIDMFNLQGGCALVGRRISDVYPSEVAEVYQDHLKRVFDTGREITFEHSLPADGETRHHIDTLYPIRKNGSITAAGGICHDITGRKKAEESLEQKTIALRELVREIEFEKESIRKDIAANITEVLLPIVQKIKAAAAGSDQPASAGTNSDTIVGDISSFAQVLDHHLVRLLSSFGRKMAGKNLNLTPREIEICSLVKSGLTSKEISSMLKVSYQTVCKHRNNIRKKLGLKDTDTNLTTYLYQV